MHVFTRGNFPLEIRGQNWSVSISQGAHLVQERKLVIRIIIRNTVYRDFVAETLASFRRVVESYRDATRDTV